MRRSYYLFSALMSCLAGGQLFAAVWTGATDSNWETNTNWQANLVPADGEAILFPSGTVRETITISSDKSVGNLTFVGANYVLQGNYTLNLPADASIVVTNTATISANIGGAATRLQKSGLGRLILSGSNTYTGKTTINDNGGFVRIETKAALGTGSVELWRTQNNTGTLELNTPGSNEFANVFINLQSVNSSYGHINNMQGTNVLTANITLSNLNGLGLSFFSTGGLLIFKGKVANGRTDSRRLLANCTTGDIMFNEIATTSSGGLYFAKTGAGTVILAGPCSYTPSNVTTFDTGTIIVGTGGSSGSLGNTNLVMNATSNKKLIFNRSDHVTFTYPVITSSASDQLVKRGDGTLKLDDLQGSFDYKIDGGTLDLNGKTLTARNLEGAGTIQNAALATAGTIEPNGTLNLPATTFGSGATINIDFATAVGGVDDHLTFADSVDLSAVTLTLRSAAERTSTGRYTLVSVPEIKTLTKPTASVVGVPYTWTCEVVGSLFQMYYVGGTVLRYR
jgi:autotransporter-associated beta strand protein